MAEAGFDAVRWLRRRLCGHVAWFQAVPNRLLEAQSDRRGDELWSRRVHDAVDRLLAELELTEQLAAPAAEAGRPAARLLDLEVCDQAAWHLAGNCRAAPVDRVGLRPGGDDDADARYVVRLAGPRRPRTAAQAGVLYSHLLYHAVVPLEVRAGDGRTYPVRIAPMAHGARLDRLRLADGVTVATVGFHDHGRIAWQHGARGSRALDVDTCAARGVELASALALAAQAGVDVLVAPELTVPPGTRDQELARLRWAKEPRLGLIVPGTFHEQEADGHFNRALVVDGQGNSVLGDVVLAHRKLAVFGQLAPGAGEIVEDIDGGTGITAVATPIGLVAVAICKDFCDVHVGDIWRQLQPEWLLVPAYGPGVEAHLRAAQHIALTTGTVTVLAHEALDSAPGPATSFVHGATAAAAPPGATFLVWKAP